jgi:chromosome segregation ATPase
VFTLGSTLSALDKQIQKHRDLKDAANDYIVVLRKASDAGKEYVAKGFDNAISFHGHKDDQLEADLQNAQQYSDKLLATLRQLPAGTKPYLTIQEEYHHLQLEELKLQDEIRERNDKAAKEKQKQLDEEKKKQDEVNKAIEKQQHEASENLKKRGEALTESLETPLEKLKDQFESFNELLNSGAISQGTYDKALKSAKDKYIDQLVKADRSGIGVTQIDTALIDIKGLQKGNNQLEIRSSQLDTVNKYLAQLVESQNSQVEGWQ